MTIELSNVRFGYTGPAGKVVIDIKHWSVGPEERVLVHGPSGGGKSTLLNLISGMLMPQSGEITVAGNRLDRMTGRQRDLFRAAHIGYVFQRFNLIPHLDAVDNLAVANYFAKKMKPAVTRARIECLLGDLNISPSKVAKFGVNIAKDGIKRSAEQILSQKDVKMSKIREIWPDIPYKSKEIDEQLEIKAHYRGYLTKQSADILAFKKDENLKIPESVNYDILSGLSNEVKSKFKKIRPKTMGQALRIDGITPAAAYILLSHVKRKSIKNIA